MVRQIVGILVLSLLPLVIFGQDQLVPDDYYVPDSLRPKENRTSVQLELGSSVSSNFNGGSAFSTTVAPYVSHKVSEDVRLNLGARVTNSYLTNWRTYSFDGQSSTFDGQLTTMGLFGQLEYDISDRTTVYGSIYHNVSTLPSIVPGTTQPLQLEGTAYSLGMKHRLSENSFLKVEVQQSTGYNPFYSNRGLGYGYSPFFR